MRKEQILHMYSKAVLFDCDLTAEQALLGDCTKRGIAILAAIKAGIVLSGANLSNADFREADFRDAKWNDKTIFFNPEIEGMIKEELK